MRVRANEIDWEQLPAQIREFAKPGQTFVTPGQEYVVLAMSVYQNVWFVVIADDYNMAEFLPLYLFTQVSMDIPPEWICHLSPDDEMDMILGPEFVARDLVAYDSLVDKEVATIDRLWEFYTTLLQRAQLEASEAD